VIQKNNFHPSSGWTLCQNFGIVTVDNTDKEEVRD